MAGFVQIVELHTTRIDELKTIGDETNCGAAPMYQARCGVAFVIDGGCG